MIAAYIRVSSKSQNLATQRDALQRAAKARGDRISSWYSERVSTRNERPELNRLKEDIRGGRFAKVYVYRLDRLSRGGICETVNLVTTFREQGCLVESISDGFSLAGPVADVVLAVLAWAAQMERAAIQERVASARKRVEAAGGNWGRPRRVTPALEERIISMRRKKRSLRYIATELDLPVSTVHAAVARLQ